MSSNSFFDDYDVLPVGSLVCVMWSDNTPELGLIVGDGLEPATCMVLLEDGVLREPGRSICKVFSTAEDSREL